MGAIRLNDGEKLELARLVHRTAILLHRHALRHVYDDRNLESIPALTPPQVHMVMVIRERGSMTLKQLSQALCVKAPAASAMVERLVDMGVLTRKENAADRREVLITMSPRDELECQEHERRHLQFAMDLLDKMGGEDARKWGTVCSRLQEILAEEPRA